MRSLWKGSLSFGLLNIPVLMYTGSQAAELSFVLLHQKDMSQIRYARICKEEGKEVPWNEIVKGFEYKKGEYVILTDEEFKKAALKKTETIDILHFTDENEIDSVYFDKPYFLEPDKGASKAYALLLESLKKSGKVGIASFVMHNHTHIGVVKPYNNALILNQLRFSAEITNTRSLDLPKDMKIPAKELEMGVKLINELTEKFKPEKYHDTYVDEIKELIERKVRGRKIVRRREEGARAPSKVQDIMSLLKASLEQPPKKRRKHVA